MTSNLSPSINRLLLGSLILILFFDFAYALLAYGTQSPLLYQSGLLSLAFLPLWVYAFLDFRLKVKQIEEKELSDKRKDHLFEQSFEHVVLNRQVLFSKTKLQPFLVVITLTAIALIAWQVTQIQWITEPQLSTAVQAAFLLFRGGLSFVLARYLQGLGKGAQSPHVETLAGLCLHHALFMVLLGLRSFLHREGLEFLETWTLALSLAPLALFLLEVPLRGIQFYYSSTKPEHPPQTPRWLWLHWGKELGSDAKSAITYQFGYDLSSSLREIGKKNAFTLLPVFLLCLWLGSCLHLVPTGHQGILTKFENVEKVLGPGLHFSLPYPLGFVEIIQTSKIHSFEIGGTGKKGEALLWNEGGHGDETYLIFQDGYGQHDLPIEVYAVNALLTYRIKDVLAYRYQHKDPLQTIRSETKSLLVQGALNLSRSSLLEQERTELNAQWKDKLQLKLDELNLGIELLHFGLPQIHPPTETNESFQELANARNQRESKILEAKGVALQKQALQDSATYKQVQQAYAQATKIITQTEGDYESLLLMQPVAEMNQDLFIKRRLLQKLIDLKQSMRKIALFTEEPIEVQSLNLEAELEPELLNLNLE